MKAYEPYQMLGLIEEDLQEALGVDAVGIVPPNTFFGFPNRDWKAWRAPWGQDLLVGGGFNTTQDANGIYIHPAGDTTIPPSGHMPNGGRFFDTIVRQEPIIEEKLDPTDNLEEFGPLPEETIRYYAEEAERAAASGRAVVANFPGSAFGDIALVPAPFLKHPRGIRDITEWYISVSTRPDYLHEIFKRQLEILLGNLKRLHEAIGDRIDAVFLCGTDFGMQRGTFCSRETYRELYHSYYRAMNDWIHAHTTWKTLKHSCGAVETFIDLFAESGFDILNPVQCSAEGMDPQLLKKKHGGRMVFWGGGVDTQKTLPFGTPAEVREEVLQRCEIFSQEGGFVFNAVHNVQAKTPMENIVAMIDAVHAFNGQV